MEKQDRYVGSVEYGMDYDFQKSEVVYNFEFILNFVFKICFILKVICHHLPMFKIRSQRFERLFRSLC